VFELKLSHGGLMEENLINKLLDFGFTINQAKVYLSIVQSGLIHVGEISKITKLHRQDVYKILPKLEKVGLIIKTLDKPFRVKAVPVERALNSLFSKEKKKANKRLAHLNANLKELTKAIENKQSKVEKREERWLIPLITSTKIENVENHIFENVQVEYALVVDLKMLNRLLYVLQERFQKLSKRGVKIRMIVENTQNEKLVKKIIEKIKPSKGDFTTKLIRKDYTIPYYIIDQKELCMCMKQETKKGDPCALWTNGVNLTRFFKERFEEKWNAPHAITIYPKEKQPEDKVEASTQKDLYQTSLTLGSETLYATSRDKGKATVASKRKGS
jgi:sugar-specific transcriptional regulator TrmB